ncbi:2-hydroxyacid dehydrogenase [Falsiroseomonas selenitidurans]|uniref:2-hydroxyacid dehydrogenase n=1 Tax=Falsiroseomonas selenitidurans TaxID=2716335 RepID=A0ABX1E5T9_9PROT|nr:2-hydroxyacid dehydrogenase [Falsiroseomonas selenitidurans]NKC32552.1 2-hydroxyacid dehydrogenase [Falsiroseomonas selenitidurans]
MQIVVFSTKPYDRRFLGAANAAAGHPHRLVFQEARLAPETAALARGAEAACVFVNDQAGAAVLESLAAAGVRILALRCAGFNNVDLVAAQRLGITVARVPAYSPESVAEHTVAMMLALNRHIHRAYHRVRDGNFALDGLLGFDMHGRTAGIVGTGRIGLAVARILRGFGCRLLAHDPHPAAEAAALDLAYVPLETLLAQADIVTLHCPLTPATHHLIDAAAIARMRPGAMLVNTSRGAIVDTRAVIAGLKSGRIGLLGLDVYEEEGDLFFEDLSGRMLQDDVFARLLTFPNVLVTAHQAFFTAEAMTAIAATTLGNLSAFAATGRALHEVSVERLA